MEERMSENIYQKLARIRKHVEVLQKDKKGYGYKYVSDEAILSKITTLMDKYNLSLIPSILDRSMAVEPYHYTKTKTTKEGEPYEEHANEVLVHADMTYTWVNNLDPEERIVIPWSLVGQQADASQSFGSGLTYSMRYFLLKFFNVATPELDPDAFRTKQKTTAMEEDRMVAKEVIDIVDTEVKAFMANNPDKTEEIKAFFTKYVKGGNYFAITESAMASKVLADFRSKFLNDGKE